MKGDNMKKKGKNAGGTYLTPERREKESKGSKILAK